MEINLKNIQKNFKRILEQFQGILEYFKEFTEDNIKFDIELNSLP